MASSNTYGGQKLGGAQRGQSGPSYPRLQSDNPLQEVRDVYRQPQEDAYKMQPGRFMPAINPNLVQMGVTDNRATIRNGGYDSGPSLSDMRMKSGNLDQNLRTQWIDGGDIDASEGRK